MATIVGPLVGGYIVDTWSWHWVFYINVPIGLLSAVVVQIFYKTDPNRLKKTDIDYRGAILMTVGLISLLSGIEMIGSANNLLVLGAFVIAFLFLGMLIYVEQHVSDPIIPARLFKNRSLVIDFTLFTLIWGAFVGFLIYCPMWAQGLLGTSALIGGATQIPSSITNFCGSGSVAPLRRILTPQKIIFISIITLILAFLMLIFFGVKTPYWLLLLAGAFEGFGNGACFNELQVKVQQDANKQDVPIATSFSFLIRMLSQTFTASIFAIIMNHALKQGIQQSHGQITMKMMNELSDASNLSHLPANLLPQMRIIFHHGLQNIMIMGCVLLLIAFAVNIWALQIEKRKFAH